MSKSYTKRFAESDPFNSPCTIKEAVQLARGVAEDVVSEYQHNQQPLQVAISLQIEILKDVVMNAGLITEEEFVKRYVGKAEEFNKKQQEAFEKSQNNNGEPKMEVKANDIEVQTEVK